ncbi:MAG: HesA/MoeB/ThiF family protein [Myxococcaceae bacterium]|nr:HesA/MoeB/ThiF family protein [Myxococcaceae bacterium]
MTPFHRARVLVVGAGGLGCPATLVLARAGIGSLTIVDPDVVDVTNLHRQLWHTDADVGRPKVVSASEKLRVAFPHLEVCAEQVEVGAANVDALFARHDLVIDGTDGIGVKFLLSDAAVRTRVPLVYGGVLQMQGQAMVIAPGGPCLRCLFETPPSPDEVPTCAQAGVLGSMAGVVGALQAELGLRQLAFGAGAVAGFLHTFDGARLLPRCRKVRRAPDCTACADGATPPVPFDLEPRSASCRR